MKKWIMVFLSLMVTIQAEQFSQEPTEMILMDGFGETSSAEMVSPSADQRHTTGVPEGSGAGNVTEEVIVISADEYFAEDELTETMQTDMTQYVSDKPKVALLVPRKVIGSYANSVANAVLSYLLYSKKHFVFEVFDSQSQTKEALTLALQKIKHKGYKVIIAPLTPEGANLLAGIEREALVYVPTVNIEDIRVENPNFVYGGIDYKVQIDALSQYAQNKIVIFGDGSMLAKKLSDYIHEVRLEDIVYSKEIKNVKANLSYLFKRNAKLKDASIFLNMPVVQSALVASQLSRYKVPYKQILSTQVNYSPLLFTLTQIQDREKFYIANAIGRAPFALQDLNALMGSDIRYNWIDYASSIGMDYFLKDVFALGGERVFSEELFAQQVYYNTEILRPKEGSFAHIDVVNASTSVKENW